MHLDRAAVTSRDPDLHFPTIDRAARVCILLLLTTRATLLSTRRACQALQGVCSMTQAYSQPSQAPVLPYARDEASTSQPLSAAHGFHDMVDYGGQMGYDPMEESESADHVWPAMQHWTNKRHLSDGNPKPPGDDDQQGM